MQTLTEPSVVQGGGDGADRRFDAVLAGSDAPQIGQRCDQADGAVAAHAEVADVVEEDDARRAGRVDRRAQQRAHDDLAAARLQHSGGAPVVIF